MYKITRGWGILEKGIPYLIVTATNWKDKNVELEKFILIVEQNKTSGMVLLSSRTRISSELGTLPKNPPLQLAKLLDEELLWAKRHYCSWLYEQIGDKAFAQIRDAVWQENNEIIPFALMYYKLNQEARKKIAQITENTYCEELRSFIGAVADLKLTVEKEDG